MCQDGGCSRCSDLLEVELGLESITSSNLLANSSKREPENNACQYMRLFESPGDTWCPDVHRETAPSKVKGTLISLKEAFTVGGILVRASNRVLDSNQLSCVRRL